MASLEGKKAPEFSLPGSDGRTHALADYRGKTVVLYFYPRDSTPGCTKEACGFRDRHRQFAKRDTVILGVSRDGLPSHAKFVEQLGLPFALLSDPDLEVMKAYGAFGEKTLYGKKVEGTIRSTVVIGPDGKIARHWTRVAKADAHPAEVLAFLQES